MRKQEMIKRITDVINSHDGDRGDEYRAVLFGSESLLTEFEKGYMAKAIEIISNSLASDYHGFGVDINYELDNIFKDSP